MGARIQQSSPERALCTLYCVACLAKNNSQIRALSVGETLNQTITYFVEGAPIYLSLATLNCTRRGRCKDSKSCVVHRTSHDAKI